MVIGAGVVQRGYDFVSVSRISPKAGFQLPKGERLPHMQTFSPKLVSHVTANSRLKLDIVYKNKISKETSHSPSIGEEGWSNIDLKRKREQPC